MLDDPDSLLSLSISTKNAFWRGLRRVIKHPKKRTIRYGLLVGNLVLLVGVASFVLNSSSTAQTNTSRSSLLSTANQVSADPLDKLSSADIAVHVARLTQLEESTSVTNRADSLKAQLTAAPSEDKITTKPQIITTTLKSRKDIKNYVAVEGDTLASLAAKFGVTTDSIKESNNLGNSELRVGSTIVVPPVNGIIVTVNAGDTPEKLAREYSSSAEAIIAFNDAEVGGLKVGEKILIPDGTKRLPAFSAPVSFGGSVSSGWGGPTYGYNGYDRGWCTWGVANRIPVPANWGNANTWDNYAAKSGWTVSTVPRAGAIAQTDAGWAGHVGGVSEVSADGTMIKYWDMNGLAGWGRYGESGWVPTHAKFQRFIYQ